MARPDSQQGLVPSILDRLIDHEPDVSTEPLWRHSINVREFQASVLRDVENLLNSRQGETVEPNELPEVAASVLTYGLPDFASTGAGGAAELDSIRRAVETALRRFEPRLREIRVSLRAGHDNFDRTIRMTVFAVLMVSPEPQAIAFDTVIEPLSGTCKVEST